MQPEQRDELQKQVQDGNNVKAVLNSKGWKETCGPMIMKHREDFIASVRANIWNPDPEIAKKVMWFVCGIDAVLSLFASIEEAGRQAKYTLSSSDTTFNPDEQD